MKLMPKLATEIESLVKGVACAASATPADFRSVCVRIKSQNCLDMIGAVRRLRQKVASIVDLSI